MNKKHIIWCLVLVLVVGNVNALVPELESCMEFNVAGTYVLDQDYSSLKTCITISTDNVILNCNNHKISFGADSSHESSGILISEGVNNVKVENCVIEQRGTGKGYGIRVESNQAIMSDNLFLNNNQITIAGEESKGVFLSGSLNTKVKDKAG